MPKIFHQPPKILFALVLLSLFLASSLIVVLKYTTKAEPSNVTTSLSTDSEEIYKSCQNEDRKERCYAAQFEAVTTNKNAKYAYDVLQLLQEEDQEARACHLIAHTISATETRKNPTKWLEIAASFDPNDCSGGFVHGPLEEHLVADPKAKLDAAVINDVCRRVSTPQSGEQNCYHIMGHLIFTTQGGQFPPSLVICSQFENTLNKSECYGGIFMENITRDNLVQHDVAPPLAWSEQNAKVIEAICRSNSGLPSQACWKEIVHMYASMFRNDADQVFDRCKLGKVSASIEGCWQHGIGIMTAGVRFSPEKTAEMCASTILSASFQKNCSLHVVSAMLSSSRKNSSNAARFCDLIAENNKYACYQRLHLTLNHFQEDLTAVCSLVEEKYRQVCLEG